MTTPDGLKIVVEGPTDVQIVRAILGEELAKKARFFAAQGRISLATIGRNILFHEGGPVLLVMDSDTLDPQLIAEREAMSKLAMSSAMTSGVQMPHVAEALASQFKVFTFVPEIEVVFFEAPQALRRLLGQAPSQEKVKEGRLIPKETLSDLLANGKTHRDYQSFVTAMDAETKQALASGSQAKALKEAVESLLASSVQT
jgi:hypothetical protein